MLVPSLNLAAILRQNRHGVFNALGRKVGSYETLDALCAGHWLKFTGETAPPFEQLYVSNFWGQRVPLSTQCRRAAIATAKGGLSTITQPQPVRVPSAVKAGEAAGELKQDGSPVVLPDLAPFIPPELKTLDTTAGKVAVVGGLLFLGLLFLIPARNA